MRPEWLWDRDISIEEVQKILKNPDSDRFVGIAALLLSRNNNPKEIFDQYLDRTIFVQQWARIKRQMRKDSWNDPRIIFWQAVYEKLVSEFKEKGIPVRVVKKERESHELCRGIGERIRNLRQQMGLTQADLAKKLGVSQQIVSRIEMGQDNMALLTSKKVAQGLGKEVSIDLL